MRATYLILLFLWFIVGYFLCKKYICKNTATEEIAAIVPAGDGNGDCSTKLLFKNKTADINFVSDYNFQFNKSSSDYNELNEELTIILGDVISFLGEDPERVMQIKGYYLEDESNNTDYSDIGLARANKVKSYFLEQGINSMQIKTIGKLGNPNCVEDDVLKKGIAVAFR